MMVTYPSVNLPYGESIDDKLPGACTYELWIWYTSDIHIRKHQKPRNKIEEFLNLEFYKSSTMIFSDFLMFKKSSSLAICLQHVSLEVSILWISEAAATLSEHAKDNIILLFFYFFLSLSMLHIVFFFI